MLRNNDVHFVFCASWTIILVCVVYTLLMCVHCSRERERKGKKKRLFIRRSYYNGRCEKGFFLREDPAGRSYACNYVRISLSRTPKYAHVNTRTHYWQTRGPCATHTRWPGEPRFGHSSHIVYIPFPVQNPAARTRN